MTIHPYHNGTGWVFDDETTGMQAEGLVQGIDIILDKFSQEKNYNKFKGFDIQFDSQPIEDHDILLKKLYEIDNNGKENGTIYYCAKYNIEGWLCPSLYLYFSNTPDSIYIKATN
jgi:hypothetical protein